MCSIETLPNGVRIVTERIDTVRSAALGIWIGGGSREETAAESGAAHFIEHMLFKGTATRSAQDIARETDAIGGQMNAFTTKECTCFYARVLDEHLAQATDILCDMVYHSAFAQSSVETERGVILEEIDMYEDTPDDLCAEKLFGAVFQGSPLARPILGVPETLATMTGDSLKAYHHSHYRGDNTVVALAGSFTQADLADLRQRFSALPAGQPLCRTLKPRFRRLRLFFLLGRLLRLFFIRSNHLLLFRPCDLLCCFGLRLGFFSVHRFCDRRLYLSRYILCGGGH